MRSPPPDWGMLVLRNGEVIEGRVSRIDGGYVVQLRDGQIRVKMSDVDVECRSLADGYQRKRALIQVGNVQHHVDLAQWCLRHNLLGPAAVEIADATTADPQNPMIAVLRRRLEMAVEPPAEPGASETKHPSRRGPSNAELDKMARGLPYKAVETFTQSVQPVLLNSCVGSGCHSSQSGDGLRLVRIGTGRSPSRRLTQRNLYAVLQYVNRENPAASRLLTASREPHGTAKHAVFDERQASQYRHLVEWVCMLAQQPMPELPADVVGKPSEPRSKKSTPDKSSTEKSRRTARKDQSSSPPADDPFDPEEFNRRHAEGKSKK